jgi:AraC-like DNA-binding protein
VRSPGLEVLAYLSPPLLSQLRVVLAGSEEYVLRVADKWDTFAEALHSASADVVVVDPCADGVCRAAALAVLLEARLTLPVVIYTPVSPVSFQAISELARHSAHHAMHHVVLHRYDDEPRRFLDLLRRQPGSSLTAALLDELGPAVDALPPSLARALERLMQHPTEFRDVADVARTAHVTVRTAYRHLTTAGFTSPRALVVAARLLQAYGFARDPRQSLSAIATKVGYSAPRMLTKHMREAFGTTPRTIRREMRPAEFVHGLAQWLSPTPVPTALLASSRVVFARSDTGWAHVEALADTHAAITGLASRFRGHTYSDTSSSERASGVMRRDVTLADQIVPQSDISKVPGGTVSLDDPMSTTPWLDRPPWSWASEPPPV